MKWLNEIVLETDHVKLVPLKQEHQHDLLSAAADGSLWDLWYTMVPSAATMQPYIDQNIKEFQEDKSLPFVVINKQSGNIIGATRYLNASVENRRLEIGGTWYAKTYQRTHVNTECKLLLLTHAFKTLKAIAVEFRTNWYNFQSRNAIARLGAIQDGVLRNHRIVSNGAFTHTVVFSILESEWSTCKLSLQHKIARMHKNDNNFSHV